MGLESCTAGAIVAARVPDRRRCSTCLLRAVGESRIRLVGAVDGGRLDKDGDC